MNTPATTPLTPAAPARPPVPGRVLVTGATGLLGSNVTAELLANGTEVLALARSRERAGRLLPAHERLRIIEGDITDTATFARHLHGAGAIIHTAAYFREYYQPGGNDPARLQRVNVEAVASLLRAAADAGVPVVVHTSSATIIGTRPGGQPSDEDTPPDPGWERNGYRASKIRAEQLIRAWPGERGLRVPVIVPAWMWGPGDAAPTASGRLFLAVARGELTAVPRVGSHVTDARDTAHAAIAAIGNGAHARRYIIAGPWQPLPAITAQIADATGPQPPRAVPAALAMAGSAAIELAARLRRHQPAATRAGTRVLLESNRQHLTSQRAERELGVTFRPLAHTIADEAAWYRSHSMLPPDPRSPARQHLLPGNELAPTQAAACPRAPAGLARAPGADGSLHGGRLGGLVGRAPATVVSTAPPASPTSRASTVQPRQPTATWWATTRRTARIREPFWSSLLVKPSGQAFAGA